MIVAAIRAVLCRDAVIGIQDHPAAIRVGINVIHPLDTVDTVARLDDGAGAQCLRLAGNCQTSDEQCCKECKPSVHGASAPK